MLLLYHKLIVYLTFYLLHYLENSFTVTDLTNVAGTTLKVANLKDITMGEGFQWY